MDDKTLIQIKDLIEFLNVKTKEYDEGHPTISDQEWDNKYFELVKLEKESGIVLDNSPTQSVVFEIVNALKKIEHNHKMLSLEKSKLMLSFNHTRNYQIGETIANSLMNLGKKNSLNEHFMVEYIGNVSSSANISTTGRLRKLFANEFSSDETTKQLQMIIDKLLKNIH